MPGPLMLPEHFDLILGQLVFASSGARNTARNRITQLLNRATFRDAEPTLTDVPAGKYGAGPTLLVTIRMASRADADAIWTRVDTEALPILQSGSVVLQSSVDFDADLGTQTTTVIHRRSFPAAPDDIQ